MIVSAASVEIDIRDAGFDARKKSIQAEGWQGGDHTALQLKLRLNAAGRHHSRVPEDTIALVRELARLMPDAQIARLLNRCGKPTGHGNGWTEQRVRGFRSHHEIVGYRDGEWAERGEITLEAAAEIIGVHKMTALRMIKRGDIKGRQYFPGNSAGGPRRRGGIGSSPRLGAGAGFPNPSRAAMERRVGRR